MYIAILGYGVVGSGAAQVLSMNKDIILKNTGRDKVELKHILDLRKFPGDVNESLVTDSFEKILNDPEVGVVIETMGGLHPAYEFVSSCLKAGKSVVTSNKELVASKGDILMKLAKENSVNFMFEASVGGGIPILRPITECLAADKITEVAGILNGTTNYILTKMFKEGVTFDDALLEAKRLGYAESDPTADVDGLDACRKICILAALCFGKHVYPDSVYTEGIRSITKADVDYAEKMGGVIKLLGTAKLLENGKITVSVSPVFISGSSQLSNVNDVFNAVLVRGNAVGDTVFYGRGAGKLPTASAVINDVISCIRQPRGNALSGWGDAEEGFVIPFEESRGSYFVRACTSKENISKVFGNVKFIECDLAPDDETAFITDELLFGDICKKIDGLGCTVRSKIRITDY
ncbi:MAG: homoserine dehydrogenase [Clostridia bacterium]|nr:homoserine dehydrogenase [Clostridia bacterium]